MLWWLAAKVLGIILILIGGFLIVFFPGIPGHQEAGAKGTHSSFGVTGIVLGFILLIIGGFLIFS